MDCQKYAVFWVDLDQSLEVEKPMSLDIPDSFPFVRLEHYEGNLQNHHKRNKMLYNKCIVLLRGHVCSLVSNMYVGSDHLKARI